jgi:malonate transporter
MLDTVTALTPVFLVITLGLLVRRIHYIPDTVWPALDQVCWHLLFPILIIRTLSKADLAAVQFGDLAGAFIIAACAMVILLFALKPLLHKLLGMTGPGYTSFFQGTSRWNGFAALAIIQALYGDAGLVLGALGFAVLVPILLSVNVLVLTLYGEPETGEPSPFSVKKLAVQLCRNPMLVSVAIGLALNFLDLEPGAVVTNTLDLVAGSALGLSLMAVGAGLKFDALFRMKSTVILSSVLKLVVMPVMIVASCIIMDVSGMPREVAVICGAAPTAGTVYIMARQMGGDADMAAAIITFQTLAAVITLPLMLHYLG